MGCPSILLTVSLLALSLLGDDNDTRGQNGEGEAARVAGCLCSKLQPSVGGGLRILMTLLDVLGREIWRRDLLLQHHSKRVGNT